MDFNNKKVLVVGLGLIGGSFCKAIKKNTNAEIFGIDINNEVMQKAISDGTILKSDEQIIGQADLIIVALYPTQTIEFIKNNAEHFKKGSILMDICGVKRAITEPIEEMLLKKGVHFIPTHPMAGREFSGYDYSIAELFEGASFIITPTKSTEKSVVEAISDLAKKIGFSKIVISTPEQHDKIIAFTSQLAHIVSNAYIKSPTNELQNGFSAGSYLDLTRVAKLNEKMWSELFLYNKDNVVDEIENVIKNLNECKKAIQDGNEQELMKILRV